MGGLIDVATGIFSAILPELFKRHDASKWKVEYENFRFSVSQALYIHAQCYHNPVNLAEQPEGNLPSAHQVASEELRRLASTASAIAAMLSPRDEKQLITKSELSDVAGYLLGLARSMATPYNCEMEREDLDDVREWESKIKAILKI